MLYRHKVGERDGEEGEEQEAESEEDEDDDTSEDRNRRRRGSSFKPGRVRNILHYLLIVCSYELVMAHRPYSFVFLLLDTIMCYYKVLMFLLL